MNIATEDDYVNPTKILDNLPDDLDEIYVVCIDKNGKTTVSGSYGAIRTSRVLAASIAHVLENDDLDNA